MFELRNDYIRNPKEDGYKSIHLIGKFKNSEGELRSIELQIRTKVQHSWATAVEIVDLFTNQSLKSNSGKTIWKDFFKHTSEQFALLENSLYLNSSENNNLIFRDFLEEFKKLNKNIAQFKDVFCFDYAISNIDGIEKFYVCEKNPLSSSFIKRSFDGNFD